jgi:hypothetical protein
MPSKGPLTYRVGVEVSTSSGTPKSFWSDDKNISGSSPGQPLLAGPTTSLKCIVQFLNREQTDDIDVEFRVQLARATLVFPNGSKNGSLWEGESFVTGPRILPWTNSQREETQLTPIIQNARGTEVISIDAIRYKLDGYPTWSRWYGGQATLKISI